MSLRSFAVGMTARQGQAIFNHLNEITCDPMTSQEELLKQLVKNGRGTEFGKAHNFDSIHNVKDYQRLVPLTNYDDYASLIERVAEGEQGLTTNKEIIHFNKTSGTMGAPKKIPLTNDGALPFKNYYGEYLFALPARDNGKKWMKGKGVHLNEGKSETLASGITFGSASAFSSESLERKSKLFAKIPDILYTSPVEARRPVQGFNTRYLHTRYALMEKNASYINATFASYPLEIFRYIESNWEMLVNDIATGTIDASVDMPEEVRASVLAKLTPMPKRANELRSIFNDGFEKPFVPRVWPEMRYIVTVGGAGFKPYVDIMKERYVGAEIVFYYLGLSASEGMVSLPFEAENFNSVFVPDATFLEFIPLDEPEDNPKVLTLAEVTVGSKYEVVVTNPSGFYRYRLKDAVEITGYYNETPTMQFLYRVNEVVSITGEKTSEAALRQTVLDSCAELNVTMSDYCMYPNINVSPARYEFLIEFDNYHTLPADFSLKRLREAIEKNLAIQNPSMGDKIKKGVCGETRVILLQPQTHLLYRDMMIMRGATGAQLKPIHIIKNEQQRKFFYALTEDMNETKDASN